MSEKIQDGTIDHAAIVDDGTIKRINLSSGQIATIEKRKGKHTVKAQSIMDGNSELYYPALMHLLVLIDGKKLAMEDYLEMDGEDFDELMIAISGNVKPPSLT